MKKFKERIREYFCEDYSFNLDTLRPDELKFIDDYIFVLKKAGGNYRIIRIINDDMKLEIEVRGGIAAFKAI